MRFEDSFTVTAPVEEVWRTLLDVERVAPCMPGAQVLERVDDDTYRVAIRVKVGPVSMRYRGEVEIVKRDDAAHRATMHVKAKEARGQGTADADVHLALADDGNGTAAAMDTEVQMSGKAAAMGQGVIAGVSARLVETFAANLAAMLEGNGAPAAAATPSPAVRPPKPVPAAASPAAAGERPAPAVASPPSSDGAAERPAAAAPPAVAAPPPAGGPAAGGTAPADEAAARPAPPPPPRPAPVADEDASLPVGKLVAGVLLARLREPGALVGIGVILAALAGLIGFRAGKRRAADSR